MEMGTPENFQNIYKQIVFKKFWQRYPVMEMGEILLLDSWFWQIKGPMSGMVYLLLSSGESPRHPNITFNLVFHYSLIL